MVLGKKNVIKVWIQEIPEASMKVQFISLKDQSTHKPRVTGLKLFWQLLCMCGTL